MDSVTRRSRFETRVILERDFLTRVNEKFGEIAPLAGMTRDAVDSWASRAGAKTSIAEVRKIADLLIEVSTRADLLADNSKDVFDPQWRPRPDSLTELREILQLTLSQTIV